MASDLIAADDELAALCRDLQDAAWIAFDTEFVAEDTYRPQLCLVQVATDDALVIIDSLAVGDMNPFWELIAGDDHEIIVHAGREEMEFCLEAVGRLPPRVVDVQIAAAAPCPRRRSTTRWTTSGIWSRFAARSMRG